VRPKDDILEYIGREEGADGGGGGGRKYYGEERGGWKLYINTQKTVKKARRKSNVSRPKCLVPKKIRHIPNIAVKGSMKYTEGTCIQYSFCI
jgi:hypothetical protein